MGSTQCNTLCRCCERRLLGESIPFATAGFALGPLLDQLPLRTSLIGSDCLRGFAVTVAGLLVLTHHVKIPAFIVIGFLMGCGQVISNAARTANVPLLAAASRQGIIQLDARIKTIRGAATLLGHPLDGFLVATVGAAPALFLDAFSYGFAASCSVWAFQLLSGYPAARIDKGPEYIARVLHGLRFIFQHRLLRILVIQSAASNMLLTPLTGIILTIPAKESWHSSRELGIILGAIGLGALAGGIAISSRPALIPGIRLYGLLVLGASLPLCAFLTGNFYLMVTDAFIAGIANVFVNIAGDTAMQRAVPADLRGRVFAPVVSQG